MPNPIVHHYWRSSSSYRVRIALNEKGVAYDLHAVNILKGEQDAPEYRQKNPLGVVPALEVDGRVLGESVAILEHLEEVHPNPPLLPSDRWLRARVRQMVEIVNAATQPLHNLVVLKRVSEDAGAQAAWARFFVERGLHAFETLAAETTGAFLVGDQLTLADVFLVPQLYGARRYDVDLERYPTLTSVEARLLARPAFQAAHPDHFKPA